MWLCENERNRERELFVRLHTMGTKGHLEMLISVFILHAISDLAVV